MRFQVPQYIDVKDKIIGPLTLKQFMFYLVGVLILVPVFMLADLALFITLAIPMAGIVVLFAHGRFAGQTAGELVTHGLSFYTGTRLYVWQRSENTGKLLIVGEEYEVDVEGVETATFTSLEIIERSLATQGNVVAEDAIDPMLEEDKELKSAPASSVTKDLSK
jgi:hypothetical protein